MLSAFLNELNQEQRKAATHVKGPTLIFAGAGSGKTKVLTYKVAHLIADHAVPPHNILMCTFTNKAAAEMKKRILTLLSQNGLSTELPYAGTFHSFAVKVLRREGMHLGIAPSFVIYDDQDQSDAIKEVLRKLDISAKNFNPNALLHTISEIKNELITALEYPQLARGYYQETVAQVYLEYQKLLQQNEALDFDDLLMKTVQLFEKFPEIQGKYQEQYKYILVDEYQDTNKAQYVLTRQLSGRYLNICVVGDASQSIYRWRGADYRNITNFRVDYPNVKEFHLEQNYRSTQTILDAAYAVISKNTSHPILKLWTEKPKGQNIVLYEARNEHDEAMFLIQTILQSGRPYTDFAILYRTNAQSRVVEEALLHAGIPYLLVGGTRFYERKEIKDVLAYLRVLSNPKDSVSYKRIEKLGKGRLERFQKLQQQLQQDNTLISETTLELLDKVIEQTEYLSLYDINKEEEAYRLENIKELRSVAMEFPELTTFLENVALVEREYEPDKVKQRDTNRSAVTLMTIHTAKGLEYPTVFVIGMEEGLFPHSRALLDKEELEEERRLCYVAITRAKDTLYLTHANHRLFFGTRTQNMPSRFLGDIPEEILRSQVSLDYDRGFREDDLLI